MLMPRSLGSALRSLARQVTVCQARSKAAAAATVTAAPATEPASAPTRGRELPPSEDPGQRDRRDASTSYGGNGSGSSEPGRPGGGSGAPHSGPRSTVRLTKAQRAPAGARQLPDSLRAGTGMAGVPVDGASRTVRMRRVPRYQQRKQQQQQQRGNPPMDGSGGVSVIDWDALDWETDVQLREEEAQQVRQVRCVASSKASCPLCLCYCRFHGDAGLQAQLL